MFGAKGIRVPHTERIFYVLETLDSHESRLGELHFTVELMV